MSEDFKIMNRFMCYLANAVDYDNWSDKFFVKELNERKAKIKKEFTDSTVDFKLMTDEELKILGFRDFDDNNKNLVPLWIFRLLDDECKMICFDGSKSFKKDADDDVRFGCVAYMIDYKN